MTFDEDAFGERSLNDLLAEILYRIENPGMRQLYGNMSQHGRHKLMERAEAVRRGRIAFPVIPDGMDTLGG